MYIRQILDILWLRKVLKIVQIGDEFGIIEQLLSREMIQVERI